MITKNMIPKNKTIIPKSLINKILEPYNENVQYIKSAYFHNDEETKTASITCELSIDKSCYVEDTGSFHAVEFNICFNQISYLLFAHLVLEDKLNNFLVNKIDYSQGLDYFLEKQLTSMFILKMESRFKQEIDTTKSFYGKISLDSCVCRNSTHFFNTSIEFSSEENSNVKALGNVLLAFKESITSNRIGRMTV